MKTRNGSFVIVLATVSSVSAADRVKPVAVGKEVPDFSVKDIQGKVWKFSKLHKRAGSKRRLPVVLSFWCSTCESCREVERPLAILANDFKGKAVGVALGANFGEMKKEIEALLKEKKLSLTVLLDSSGKTADLFHNRVTTTTVVIDAKGVLRYHGRFGNRRRQYARNALEAVLAGQTVSVKKSRPHG